MNINDLSISKELDSKALAEVRGGGQEIYSQTIATSDVNMKNFGGVQVSLNETTANSAIFAYNQEDNSTTFGGLYPWYF